MFNILSSCVKDVVVAVFVLVVVHLNMHGDGAKYKLMSHLLSSSYYIFKRL